MINTTLTILAGAERLRRSASVQSLHVARAAGSCARRPASRGSELVRPRKKRPTRQPEALRKVRVRDVPSAP